MSNTLPAHGLSLAPLRALRYTSSPDRLGGLLCPPYDVIDPAERAALLSRDPDNAVQIVLPVTEGPASPGVAGPDAGPDAGRDIGTDTDADAYARAAATLTRWAVEGLVAVDDDPALFVYEMRTAASAARPETVTRGLLGAVQLRDPEDGVILPHENTMAGPVADRLALMEATNANLEPIYLVYDGGGAASRAVAAVQPPDTDTDTDIDTRQRNASGGRHAGEGAARFVTSATTPDGTVHRLWAITDPSTLADIATDLDRRHALIADGHHRYATYRTLAERRQVTSGPGPWDRGLALLVDSSAYGPQVHAIHRVIPDFTLERAVELAAVDFTVGDVTELTNGDRARTTASPAAESDTSAGFAVVLTDGRRRVDISAPRPEAVTAARREGEPIALLELDVSILHRVLIERSWGIADTEATVRYAHSSEEALSLAAATRGLAVLVNPTPVAAVAAVAVSGARMPRKSTLFTPKPASGLVMRRFCDQPAEGMG